MNPGEAVRRMHTPDADDWNAEGFDETCLINIVLSKRQAGCNLLVQCLPKTGSSSVAEALRPVGAIHELDMHSVLNLSRLRSRPNFEQHRQHWLQARQQRLQGRVDVCTSLALVVADLDDESLMGYRLERLILNRSLTPWLHSMVNWSFMHEANPYSQGWITAYHAFVDSVDQELARAMPTLLNDLGAMIDFWIPIWLTYQAHIEHTATANQTMVLTENLRLGIRANVSHFKETYNKAFAAEMAELPSLNGQREHDRACVETIRHWFINERAKIS